MASNDYCNVMDFYVTSIYKSGLLLDEHVELLNQFWEQIELPKTKYLKLCLISTSVMTGFIISVYKRSFSLALISTVPVGIDICRLILRKYKCHFYKKEFSIFINVIQEIFILTKKIMQYYQLRKLAINSLSGNTKQNIENVLLKRLFNFLFDTEKLLMELMLFLKEALKQVSNVVDIGELNFMFIIDINKENFKSDMNEENILYNFEKIQMAYIYVVSTFLCCIGLSLCISEWKSANKSFTKIFSQILPECLKYASRCGSKMKERFASMCNALQKRDFEDMPKKGREKPNLNIINSLKEHIQISFSVVTVMQNELISCSDDSIMRNYLENLENLFIQCSDILRTLQCQVYTVPLLERESIAVNKDTKVGEMAEIVMENYSDHSECLVDEEYNLSIHGSDFSDNSEPFNLEYEQLLEYVKVQKLMIKELNDELRKRNIVTQKDVTPILPKRSVSKGIYNEPPPPLVLAPSPLVTKNVVTPTVSEETVTSIVSDISSVESRINFLAQICAAATNRGVEETIFGDDIFLSDESSEH